MRRVVVVLLSAAAGSGCCGAGGAPHDEPEAQHGERARRERHGRREGHERGAGEGGEPAGTVAPPAPGGAGRAQSVHLTMGRPAALRPDPSDDVLVIKPQYALSYNPKRNDPNWVSWQLDASYLGEVSRYRGKFAPDEALPADVYRVRHEDYTGSSYDRGHMCPSDDRTKTEQDNQATFVTSNLVPQTHDNNAGPWERLESYGRKLAREGHELYVTAGGVFGASPQVIGHGVAVPDSTFKIIVVLDKGQTAGNVTPQTRVIAIVTPNRTGIIHDGWGTYRASVASIERETGFTFLTDVPEPVRDALKERVDAGPTD